MKWVLRNSGQKDPGQYGYMRSSTNYQLLNDRARGNDHITPIQFTDVAAAMNCFIEEVNVDNKPLNQLYAELTQLNTDLIKASEASRNASSDITKLDLALAKTYSDLNIDPKKDGMLDNHAWFVFKIFGKDSVYMRTIEPFARSASPDVMGAEWPEAITFSYDPFADENWAAMMPAQYKNISSNAYRRVLELCPEQAKELLLPHLLANDIGGMLASVSLPDDFDFNTPGAIEKKIKTWYAELGASVHRSLSDVLSGNPVYNEANIDFANALEGISNNEFWKAAHEADALPPPASEPPATVPKSTRKKRKRERDGATAEMEEQPIQKKTTTDVAVKGGKKTVETKPPKPVSEDNTIMLVVGIAALAGIFWVIR